MAYSEKLMDHYEHPRNVGTLDVKDDNVGTGMVGAPACGDVMRLQIKVIAYKLIRKLNQELEKEGFLVIAGKVPRRYFEKRWYGFSV